MIKTILAVLLGLVLIASVSSAEWVNGYMRKDGTYVNGYERSDRNNTVIDNYSYKGNVSPYTGEEGHNYYRNNPTSEYYGTSGSNNNNYKFNIKPLPEEDNSYNRSTEDYGTSEQTDSNAELNYNDNQSDNNSINQEEDEDSEQSEE